jgi:ATP-dependent exoDNAse (exonuclease V) beta subunit
MPLTAYRSSAGSGKTFTLVKEYLKLVLTNPGDYRHVLAVTFTNKAANEMKQRILENLKEFSRLPSAELKQAYLSMKDALVQELKLPDETIASRSKDALTNILHDYSEFAVGTIDSFVNRIARTFAFDLHIPANFETELDGNAMLEEVVDILIDKAGIDKDITRTLVEFARSKADDEKSWNIEKDLVKCAGHLFREEGYAHIEKLKNLDAEDFHRIYRQIRDFINGFERTITDMASGAVQLILSTGLTTDAFYYGNKGIGRYFEYLSAGRFDKLEPNTYVVRTIHENIWFSGTAGEDVRKLILSISGRLAEVFGRINGYVKEHGSSYAVLKLVVRSLFQVSVLNEIGKVLDGIMTEKNKLHISEFNKRISGIVLREPVPYIYERIGEKYRHFLIDEFQDTSVLQWHNLLPLVENSLSANNGNFLVGDCKQAIYRWRSGEVEQFARLPEIMHKEEHPVLAARETVLRAHYRTMPLNVNRRSGPGIVEFNNRFFRVIAGSEDLPGELRSVYSGLEQEPDPVKKDGYVRIEFHEGMGDAVDYTEEGCNRVLDLIGALLQEGYACREIAVLCRKNRTASDIARYLVANDVPVVSSESLLLGSSIELNFIAALLGWMVNPDDGISRGVIIAYLHGKGILRDGLHEMLTATGNPDPGCPGALGDLYTLLASHGIDINRSALLALPLYTCCEEIIRLFGLDGQPDPYIQYFLDEVHSFSSKNNPVPEDFLRWWNEQKDKKSIIFPEAHDAVRIMTIHKAKGLQFPVVIFPFADETLRLTREEAWISCEGLGVPDLPSALIRLSRKLLGTSCEQVYTTEEEKTKLDFINLLYVVMTRPEERLYVLTSYPSRESRAMSVPSLIKGFLEKESLWSDGNGIYEFGRATKPGRRKDKEAGGVAGLRSMHSFPWWNRALVKLRAPDLWDLDNPEKSREWGRLIHEVLSKIYTPADAPAALEDLANEGALDGEGRQKLQTILDALFTSPETGRFFAEGLRIKNEPEIILPGGTILRPDRVVISDDEVSILDYKTGTPSPAHGKQVSAYARCLHQMGYTKVRKFLLYVEKGLLQEVG